MGSPTHQQQQNSLGSNSAYANSPFSPGSSSQTSVGGRKAFTFLPKAVEASNANYAAGKVTRFGVGLFWRLLFCFTVVMIDTRDVCSNLRFLVMLFS
jgi:hypothetical protein